MTLIIKEKQISIEAFDKASNRMRDRVRDIYGSNFSCWYSSLTGVAQFKINEKHRNLIEVILLDY